MERQILTVSQVNGYVKSLLDNDPALGGLYVRGELSNYKCYPSGHHYFTLKDAECSLRCVLFRSQAARLRFQPQNGMKVIALGRVGVYPRDGAYQLYCDALSPDGVGDLHVAFEQLKERLYREGLFDSAHKKPLPLYPRTIAIVTSPAGAAIHDMLRILGRRWPLAGVKLLPVRVQGAEAPAEIAGAIRYASRYKVADLVITGRGGGSLEDLWAFNDERVARAIYDCDLPIISAVGHEPDVTISDFVADARAATPSHAAELAVPDRGELAVRLRRLQASLLEAQEKHLTLLERQLTGLSQKRVLTDRAAVIDNKAMALDRVRQSLIRAGFHRLSEPYRQLSALSASLDALSPLKVLGRGFALVTDREGRIVRDAGALSAGDHITARLAKGQASCLVEAVSPDAPLIPPAAASR